MGEHHCGVGLEVELSFAASMKKVMEGKVSRECNVFEWMKDAADDPTFFADFMTSMTDLLHSSQQVFSQKSGVNTETDRFQKEFFRYFRKLQAQAALFSADYSIHKGREDGLEQNAKQTKILFGMAKLTAQRRIGCKTNIFKDIWREISQKEQDEDTVDTNQCEIWYDEKQAEKKKYCDEFPADVNKDKCFTALSRHTDFFQKVNYYFAKSGSVKRND